MIHSYRVQNFKSITDVVVDLSSVTVLIGKSGSGKSNFVDSLRFLRDLLSSRYVVSSPQSSRSRFRDQKSLDDAWDQIKPASTSAGATKYEIEFSIGGLNDRFRYELELNEKGPQNIPLLERLNLGSKCLFHQEHIAEGNRRASRWIVEPELLDVPAPGGVAIGRIPSITEVVIAFTALTSGIACHVFPDNVLCGGKVKETIAGFGDNAENYLLTLKEIVSNLQDLTIRKNIVGALQRINPSVSSVELNNIQDPSFVLVGHKFGGKTLALKLPQESSGFRRFYAHLLALYQRPPKQTLVFEHPEDGIHPGAMAVLAEEIKSAPSENRGQVILTTHNPELLDHFDPDEIRVVELVGFETEIGPMASEQREAIKERLLKPGELLNVDPARIERRSEAASGQ